MAALLAACSGTGASPSPPGPSPTYTPTPTPTYTPTPSPTKVLPTESPGQTLVLPSDRPTQPPDAFLTPSPSFSQLWIDFLLLPLHLVGVPPETIEPDDTGDAVGLDGTPRDISPDLDITDTYVGWAELPPGSFGPKGVLDCASDRVLCTNEPQNPPDGYFVLGAIQTGAPIQLGPNRAGQVAIVFDRPGIANSPANGDGFGGGDLVIIGNLSGAGSLFGLEWKNGQWRPVERRAAQSRILIDGQTVLFGVPTDMGEDPNVRFVTFERIPPDVVGGERFDAAPGFKIDSFFDIYYEIEPPPIN